ncbi:hypothetical protein OAA90_06285 [Salibacteraceae bacterium]|nr:hypothetical protein [Salibacteraceae bacterium]
MKLVVPSIGSIIQLKRSPNLVEVPSSAMKPASGNISDNPLTNSSSDNLSMCVT